MLDDPKEINIPCNLCGLDDYSVVYEKVVPEKSVEINDMYSAAKGVLCTDQVVRCNNCGLVYINPRLDAGIIIKACSEGDDEVYVSQEAGRIATFGECLEFAEKYAKKKGSLLDVGCAAGFFLKVAKDSGWNVLGIEPNKWLGDYGRKKFDVEVLSSTLEEAKLGDKRFDIITMWDVLEHMPNPKSGLLEANRVMKDDGVLIISYPDYGSIFSKIFGRKWWFFLSHHLYYFTPKTLEKMLNETGFKVIKSKRHFQRLKIGYMVNMARNLSGDKSSVSFLGSIQGVLNFTGLNDVQIPYYASQKDIVARKIRNV